MKILVVGGSNTAMRPGYVGDLSALLRERVDGESFEVHSVALGANACTMGLEMLQGVDLKNYDVVCIEYFINDTLLLGTERNRPTWLAAYVGLHKLIQSANPDARIIDLVLCRMKLRGTEEQMRLSVLDIAEKFGATVVDVDATLRGSLSQDEFVNFYSNNSHYAPGVATARVAGLLSDEIINGKDRVASAKRGLSDTGVSFEHVRVLSLHATKPERSKLFQNSRYMIKTLTLTQAEPFVVTVPGSLISVSFLSVPSSGTVLIHEEGEEPILVDTAHKEVASGRFTFLVQSIILKNKTWSVSPEELAAPRRVTFELVSTDRRGELACYLQPSSLIEASLPEQEQTVQLIGCMFYSNGASPNAEEDPGLTFVSGKVFRYV